MYCGRDEICPCYLLGGSPCSQEAVASTATVTQVSLPELLVVKVHKAIKCHSLAVLLANQILNILLPLGKALLKLRSHLGVGLAMVCGPVCECASDISLQSGTGILKLSSAWLQPA